MNTHACQLTLVLALAGAALPGRAGSVSLPIALIYEGERSPRGLLPVETTVFIEGDVVPDPARAPWSLEYQRNAESCEPWPCQLDDWRKIGGKSAPQPSWTARLAFFPPEGSGKRVSFRLRLVDANEAQAPQPATPGRFRLARDPKQWTIECGPISFHLDGDHTAGSGQLAAVTVATRSGPEKLGTQRGPSIHRNPDLNIHGRPWAHAHKWNPPDATTTREGPVVIEIVRTGSFPGLPEARLRMRYRFFACRGIMESASEVELLEDVAVIALRNDQLIFAPGTFSHFCWRERSGIETRRFADYTPINDHGDILKLWADTPWVLFWNPHTAVSTGTVRRAEFASGPGFGSAIQFDRTTLIMNREQLQSWVRPQVYQNVSWSRQAGIHLPAGSRFSEIVLYCFSGETTDPNGSLIERLYQETQSPPLIEVGNGPFPTVP